MSSFLAIPPEIRTMIYKMLLPSTSARETRILYFGNNPLRSGVEPDCIRHKQPCKRIGSQGGIKFLDTRTTLARHIALAEYIIHLANIDDLLFLASTCRLIRSESLALSWSNADIYIEAPETYNEMHCIFYDRLTSQTCNFIRTLSFNIDYCQWSPLIVYKVVDLIRVRLQQVEQLIVNGAFGPGDGGEPFAPGIAVLKTLPQHIAVELRTNPVGKLRSRRNLNAVYPGVLARKDKHINAHPQSLRTQIGLIRQNRREGQLKREQEDQDGDILEATVEMRSLMAGSVGCNPKLAMLGWVQLFKPKLMV